jgi:hypothetical protein
MSIIRNTKHALLWTTVAVLTICPTAARAQTISRELQADANKAAGANYALPVTVTPTDTPAPDGKKPFYINHYGCPASHYLKQSCDYDAPYATLAKADSLGKLTALGRDVMKRVALLRAEAKDRTNELTTAGRYQSRALMRQMVQRFPEAFTIKGYYSARSILKSHCVETMNEAMVQLSQTKSPLQMNIRASQQEKPFMDPEDAFLEAQRKEAAIQASYAAFAKKNTDDRRLMTALFNDSAYVAANVDATALGTQLFTLAGSVQHTNLRETTTLFDIFTPEEILRHWRVQNASNYISYGGYRQQPYMQRATLRNMMHMGDSVLKRYNPIIHVRYTHEGVVMALACLMELDGFGLQTDSLETLEAKGWADYRIAPRGGSIEMIHYRSSRDDKDVLVKVLLNGREAQLPIQTDCAPFYHWNDVKRYYLRKLYRYENTRFTSNIQ